MRNLAAALILILLTVASRAAHALPPGPMSERKRNLEPERFGSDDRWASIRIVPTVLSARAALGPALALVATW